ncbi:acyl transferase/acyl hydrolase/lysophospholipase [Podospora appendiculata]|uniref:Acyl transferase/acyl hydrolase/lysophospholipase n=1 Tax=Podospora appendiculata TaxID=314037 RepID=A0AAE0X3N4_9PEZI|nr:acyl transferase/acyl hydrolase/lysophospholipase [Podospora appendiculata]
MASSSRNPPLRVQTPHSSSESRGGNRTARPPDSGSPAATSSTFSSDADDAWSTINVLCFDGGGIRGIFSLLVLKRLMEYVRLEEEAVPQDAEEQRLLHELSPAPISSSFWPCEQPNHVSHIRDQHNPQSYTRYLPCHYFDFICGTSTGGLITIMLSRLRMPVEDCLEEYKRLAGNVFGKPHLIHKVGVLGAIGLARQTKFKTEKLEQAIKDVLRRRGERALDSSDMMLFQTQTGLCRSFVVANRETRGSQVQASFGDPWIFRSYRLRDLVQDAPRSDPRRPHDRTPGRPRNPGQGTNIAAWKVARATTAAKHYFKPLRIYLDDGDVMLGSPHATADVNGEAGQPRMVSFRRGNTTRQSTAGGTPLMGADQPAARDYAQFTDGGFGGSTPANNPSREALREIDFLKRQHQKVGTFVSIGTAKRIRRTPAPGKKEGVRDTLSEGVDAAGEVRGVDELMREASQRPHGPFDYFRLNSENGLENVEMDDWAPRASGERTLAEIQAAFDRWAGRIDVVGDLQDCAHKLVRLRRRRLVDRSMWDRYAIGKYFVCNREDCKKGVDETWNYKSSFRLHLQYDHGIEDEAELERHYRSCEGGQWKYKPPRDLV